MEHGEEQVNGDRGAVFSWEGGCVCVHRGWLQTLRGGRAAVFHGKKCAQCTLEMFCPRLQEALKRLLHQRNLEQRLEGNTFYSFQTPECFQQSGPQIRVPCRRRTSLNISEGKRPFVPPPALGQFNAISFHINFLEFALKWQRLLSGLLCGEFGEN